MKELNLKKNDNLNEYLLKELTKHGGYDSTFVTDVVAKSNFTLFTFDKNQSVPLSEMARMLNPKAKYATSEIAAAEIAGNVDRLAKNKVVNYYSDNLIDLNADYRNLMNCSLR